MSFAAFSSTATSQEFGFCTKIELVRPAAVPVHGGWKTIINNEENTFSVTVRFAHRFLLSTTVLSKSRQFVACCGVMFCVFYLEDSGVAHRMAKRCKTS